MYSLWQEMDGGQKAFWVLMGILSVPFLLFLALISPEVWLLLGLLEAVAR